MLRNIVAVRRDGFDVKILTIIVDVPSFDFDLKAAVEAAATDYVKTPEGRHVYKGNHSEMNWADFSWSVPNSFCEKHGFKRIETAVLKDLFVNWDEDLVDESQVYDEEDDESEEE
jgi:hypothetical protein